MMVLGLFGAHDGLQVATRFPAIGRRAARISAAEIATLLLAGVTAAVATGFVRLGLRLPGHAIVLAVMPMTLGLALVPRRFAGIVMSGSALATAVALGTGGLMHLGVGALTSLSLVGPTLDVALLNTGPGWRLYARLAGAGLACNFLAFVQRGASKLLELDKPGTRLLNDWFSQAVVTYTLSGVVAGLLGAFCWFQFRPRSEPTGGEPGT